MTSELDLRKQADLVEQVAAGAGILHDVLARHANAENPEVVQRAVRAVQLLIDYGHALAEGRVALATKKPRLAVLDGGKSKD